MKVYVALYRTRKCDPDELIGVFQNSAKAIEIAMLEMKSYEDAGVDYRFWTTDVSPTRLPNRPVEWLESGMKVIYQDDEGSLPEIVIQPVEVFPA